MSDPAFSSFLEIPKRDGQRGGTTNHKVSDLIEVFGRRRGRTAGTQGGRQKKKGEEPRPWSRETAYAEGI